MDHSFPIDLFSLKQQIELGALVNIIFGDELEVGCHGHHRVRACPISATSR
jgi:hypothetical protein